MAILASKIISDCAKQLQDDTNITWPRAELFGWLNMGRRQVCIAKPDAFVKNESRQLAPGTKQTIPAEANIFMKATRNMGSNGTTPGRAILPIPLNVLDEQNPNWHTATPSATVLHVGFDERDPKHYYVYPPQPATNPGYAEIIYSATPADIADESADIGMSDLFEGALFNFIMAMAYGKDSEYTRNDQKSADYLKRAGDLLAGMGVGEAGRDARNAKIGNQRAGAAKA